MDVSKKTINILLIILLMGAFTIALHTLYKMHNAPHPPPTTRKIKRVPTIPIHKVEPTHPSIIPQVKPKQPDDKYQIEDKYKTLFNRFDHKNLFNNKQRVEIIRDLKNIAKINKFEQDKIVETLEYNIAVFYLFTGKSDHLNNGTGKNIDFFINSNAVDYVYFDKAHDYIQRIFPTRFVPVITDRHIVLLETIAEELYNSDKFNLKTTLSKCLNSYSTYLNWFNNKNPSWINGNHNQARITRIIECLCSFGYKTMANQFLDKIPADYYGKKKYILYL